MTTTRNEVTAMFNRFAGQSATLVIPRPYIDLCEGDHLAALLLSQILYWSDRTSDPDGWFAKSYADWTDELALTERQIKRIVSGDDRRKTKGFSLDTVGVKTKLARSDYYKGAATLHYRIDYDVLSAKILAFSQVPTIAGNHHCGKPPNGQNDDPTNGQNDHIHRLRSETTNTTGAKSAPDADAVVWDAPRDANDDELAELDLTLDGGEIDPVGEYYRDMATVDAPVPDSIMQKVHNAPDDFKAIQEHTVVTVFKSNDRMYGKAGDIANWALRRNSKPQWIDYPPERAFVMFEWGAFLEWYACLDIEWPSSAEKWNKWAFKFRASPEYRQLMKPPRTEPPLTDEIRMANVRELMTPFPTGNKTP